MARAYLLDGRSINFASDDKHYTSLGEVLGASVLICTLRPLPSWSKVYLPVLRLLQGMVSRA